ncbi:MAG: hypothetical protein KIS62_12345 [Ramlibacter sp.]|nr:hypothetical protein [Ramlibacter sp.]MCW5650528.1 hypothetical protein [Ramlibacter sp.]
MGSIASMKVSMGFHFAGGASCCGNCSQREQVGTGLRCARGGFWVNPANGCKEYSPSEAAPAPDTRIQIGPTDV